MLFVFQERGGCEVVETSWTYNCALTGVVVDWDEYVVGESIDEVVDVAIGVGM